MVAAVTNQVVAYRARNLVNGKHYIGVTKRGLGRREHEHRYAARTGSDFLLHKAIRKYGDEAFVFEVIFDFDGDYELAMLYEAEAVEKERPAYNLVPGGLNRVGQFSEETLTKMRNARKGIPSGRKGVPMPEEQRLRMIGQKRSAEARAAMSAAAKQRPSPMVGKKHTAEAKAKMAVANRGRVGYWAGRKRPGLGAKVSAALKGRASWNKGLPMPEETKRRVSAAKTGVKQPQTAAILAARAVNFEKMRRSRMKAVVCLNDGRVFESAKAAGDFYGVDGRIVARIAQGTGPHKSIRGYRFRYEVPKS